MSRTMRLATTLLVLSVLAPAIPAGANELEVTGDGADVSLASTANPALDTLNELRAMSGLAAVTEDAAMTDGARRHSEYMVRTGTMTHSEDPSSEWYSVEGDLAARQSNLAAFGSSDITARDATRLLMVSPFHGLAFIDPALSRSGAALFSDGAADRYRSALTINVTGGRSTADPTRFPVLWPGHHSTTDLLSYPGGEYPDPLSPCPGYTAPTGAPLLLIAGSDQQVRSAELTDDDGRRLDVCAFDRQSYVHPDPAAQDAGRRSLASRNAIVVIPREPLAAGLRYHAHLTTSSDDLRWSFTTAGRSAAPPSEPVDRLAGADRIATAIEVSRAGFLVAPTVVLARSDAYADALAGAPLARELLGPVLLSGRAGLDPAVGSEIRRLGAVRAVLLGGRAALSTQVERDLRAAGVLTIERISGADRFEVAAKIAERIGGDHAFVVEGANADPARGWPDALSAGAVAAREGAPILFVTRDTLPEATRRVLTDLSEATVVGGPVAISDRVLEEIRQVGPRVTRVSGPDRYATSTRLADLAVRGGADPDRVWLATGRNWPDALSAGPAVAALGEVLVLVDGADRSGAPATYGWLSTNAGDVAGAVVVGGRTVVTEPVAGHVGFVISAG